MAAAQLHHHLSSPSSSSSTAESNFRELDDVFLKTQTRIWLGEVLQIRLDEQMNISDLLADGELLFEASRVVWQLLLKSRMELRHTKAYKYEPFASRKSSGKYMPYSNVDSFLKICKILGLTGIDLFTPSDVVEKKNTRKVCMCIRSLTKKARSKHLNVPDFDIVTYTVAMPTNMVKWIRRSLERSQCSFSNSASDYSRRNSKSNSTQNNMVLISPRSYDSDSEESDAAESNPTILQSDSSLLNYSNDGPCQMNSIVECLPGVASATDDYMTSGNLELDIQNTEKVENTQLQSESLCESVGSLYTEHDFEQNDMTSPTRIDSIISLSDGTYTESGMNKNSENGASAVEDSIDAKTPMNSTDRNSNDFCFQIYCDDSSLLDREDSNGFKSNSSHGSNATQSYFENGFRRFSDDDMEVSSTANMRSEAMMSLDFYDQLDAKDDFGTVCSYNLQSPVMDISSKSIRDDTSQELVNHETLMQNMISSSVKPSLDLKVSGNGLSTILFITCSDLQPHTDGYIDNISFENDVSVSRTNPIAVQDEANLSRVDSNAHLSFEECEELPLDQYTSQCQSDNSDVEERCMVTVASIGNDGLEPPSNSASNEGSLEEKLRCSLTEDAKDIIQMVNLKSIVSDNNIVSFSATMSESVANINGLTDNHLRSVSFDDILEIAYEDPSNTSAKNVAVEESGKDLELRSTTYQGQDMPDEGENGYQVDHKEHVCSQSINEDETEQGKVGDVDRVANVNVETQNSKPLRRPLLKSVVKGTAVLSMLFIAFHLRRNGREQIGALARKSGVTGEATTEDSHVQKTNGVKLSSSRKVQKGGIYPAEKLNFW